MVHIRGGSGLDREYKKAKLLWLDCDLHINKPIDFTDNPNVPACPNLRE